MSPHSKRASSFSTAISQWFGLTHPKPLTEYECYMKIYGDLIYCCDFYVHKSPKVELLRDWNKILDKIFADNDI